MDDRVAAWVCPELALAYGALGIERLHPWQTAALRTPGVLLQDTGCIRNFLFSAPTSGGKSLVAELILLSTLLKSRPEAATPLPPPCALFVLPYVALVDERFVSFSRLLRLAPTLKLRVAALHGKKSVHDVGKAHVVVCTPEKASSLIAAMGGAAARVRCVVVDEIHLVGEPGRGAILEALLSKLLAYAPHVQLVGMSATVPNLDELARWLNAACFVSTARPVHLIEYVCVDGTVRRVSSSAKVARSMFDSAGAAAAGSAACGDHEGPAHSSSRAGGTSLTDCAPVSCLVPPPHSDASSSLDPRVVLLVPLVAETAALGGQSLVFAPDRRSVQETAHVLRRQLTTHVSKLSQFLHLQGSPRDDGERRWEPGALASLEAASRSGAVGGRGGTAAPPATAAGCTALAFSERIRRLRLQASDQLRLLLDSSTTAPAGRKSGLRATVGLPAAVKEMEALVRDGVAYHHAGLPPEVRSVVEHAFRVGALWALVCTSTLAAGINLPARRVIVYGVQVGRDLLPLAQYRQMVGRAGRTGLDPYGESVLVVPLTAQPATLQHVAALVSQALPPVRSCLLRQIDRYEDDGALRLAAEVSEAMGATNQSGSAQTVPSGLLPALRAAVLAVAGAIEAGSAAGLAKLILEAIDSGLASSPASIYVLAQRTLMCSQIGEPATRVLVSGCLAYMLALHVNMLEAAALGGGVVSGTSWLVSCAADAHAVHAQAAVVVRSTQKGRAACTASLSPCEAVLLYNELAAARRQLLLRTPAHALYCCVPISPVIEPPWRGGSGQSEIISYYQLWVSHIAQRRPDIVEVSTLMLPADVEGQRLYQTRAPLLDPSFLSEARAHADTARGAALKRGAALVSASQSEGSASAAGRAAMLIQMRARRLFATWLLSEFLDNPHPWGGHSMEHIETHGAPPHLRLEHLLTLAGVAVEGLEKLIEEAAGFAATVFAFCSQLSWLQLARVARDVSDALRRRYPPAMQIFAHLPAMTLTRATALSSMGWTTLTAIASAPISSVVLALQDALPVEPPPWGAKAVDVFSFSSFAASSDARSALQSGNLVPQRVQPRVAISTRAAALNREASAGATIVCAAKRYLDDRAKCISLFGQRPQGMDSRRFPLGHCLPLELVKSGQGDAMMGAAASARTREYALNAASQAGSQRSVASAPAAGADVLDGIAQVAGGSSAARDYPSSPDLLSDNESLSTVSEVSSDSAQSEPAASLFSEAGRDALSPTPLDDSTDGSSTFYHDDGSTAAYFIDTHDTPRTQLAGNVVLPAAWAPMRVVRMPAAHAGVPQTNDAGPLVSEEALAGFKRSRQGAVPAPMPAKEIPASPVCDAGAEELQDSEPNLLQAVLDASPARPAFRPPEVLVPCPQHVLFGPPPPHDSHVISFDTRAADPHLRGVSALELDPIATRDVTSRADTRQTKALVEQGEVAQRGASVLLASDALRATVLAGRSAAPPLKLLLPQAAIGTFSVITPIARLPHVVPARQTVTVAAAGQAGAAIFQPVLELREFTQVTRVEIAAHGEPRGGGPSSVTHASLVVSHSSIAQAAGAEVVPPKTCPSQPLPHFRSFTEQLAAACSASFVSRLSRGSQKTSSVISAGRAIALAFARRVAPPWSRRGETSSDQQAQQTRSGQRSVIVGVGISRGASDSATSWVSLASPPPAPPPTWRGAGSAVGNITGSDLHGVLLLSLNFLGVGCMYSEASLERGAGGEHRGAAAVASVSRSFYAAYVDSILFLDETVARPARSHLESTLSDASQLKVLLHSQTALASARHAGLAVHGEVADPLVAAWLLDPEAETDADAHQTMTARAWHSSRSGGKLSAAVVAEFAKRVLTLSELNNASGSVAEGLRLCSEPYLHLPVSTSEPLQATTEFLQSAAGTFADPAADAGRFPSRAQAPALDAITWALMSVFGVKLRAASLELPFRYIEMPMLRVLADMMADGVGADSRTIARFVISTSERLQVLQQALRDTCPSFVSTDGGPLDPRRATDIARALFVLLQAPMPVPGAIGSKSIDELCSDPLFAARATTSDALAQLASGQVATAVSGFCSLLLEFRSVLALHQRTLRPLQRAVLVDSTPESLAIGDGLIRPVFDYHTATGRLSCATPNLQALPKDTIHVAGVARPSLHEEMTRTDGYVWVRRRGALVRAPLEDALRDPFQSRCLVVLARQSQRNSAAALAVSEASSVGGESRPLTSDKGDAPLVPLTCICSRIGSIAAVHYNRNLMAAPVIQPCNQSSDADDSVLGHAPTAGDFVVPSVLPAALQRSLLQFWRELGFTYTDAAAREISQVTVLFRPPGTSGRPSAMLQAYAYPADKVFRLAAPIFMPPLLPQGVACSQQPWSTPIAINVRDVLRARPGYVLVAADYAQIEVRVLAHLAQDASLISVLVQADDVFRSIGMQWLGRKSEAAVTSAERAQVKQLVYAILYGASTSTFAAALGTTVAEAAALTENFRRAFPAVFSFLKGVVEHCQMTGYVDTLCGRRRHLPGISGGEGGKADGRSSRRAARQAVNTTCQGSAADVIKIAAANVSCVLEVLYGEASMPGQTASALDAAVVDILARLADASFAVPVPGQRTQRVARILLQVHDELVLEVRREQVLNVAALLRHCMEHAVALRVPLRVALSTGDRYGSLKPLLGVSISSANSSTLMY